MTVKDRYRNIMEWFSREMPDPETELQYGTPFELLVSVILSAQCTDKRVNMVTPALFKAFPDVYAMAEATFEQLHPYLTSVNYHNTKTKALLGMARRLVDEFDGQVPDNIDDLTSLPGVGRKTANVMLAVAFNRRAMAVDTHVFRVSERLGLTTRSKNPLQTEQRLVANIPGELLPRAHHWLIRHGRYVCKARRPDCDNCGLRPWCRYYDNLTRTTKISTK